MKLIVALTALAMSTLSFAQQQSLSNDFIYEIYLNGLMSDALPQASPKEPGNPAKLKSHYAAILQETKALAKSTSGPNDKTNIRLFWNTTGQEVRVGPTLFRVRGAFPPCTTKKNGVETDTTLDEDIKEFAAAFGVAGSALDAALLDGVPLFSGLVAAVFSGVINHNRYQTKANCAAVCAVVPAVVKESEMEFNVYFAYDNAPLTPRAVGYWGGWELLEPVVVGTDIFAAKNGYARLNGAEVCQAKLVCTRLRNWHSARSVRARLDVKFDAIPNQAGQMCTDPTMVASEYKAVQYKAMDKGDAKKYLENYVRDQYETLK